MAKRKGPPSISDQLREIIRAEVGDGSLYDLAAEAGINRSVLSRFLAGKRTMTLETADRLGELLRLRIVGRGQ